MAAHRYWRVKGTPTTTALSCAELELRGSVGGADLTGSGTAISSSVFSGAWLAEYAFNNVTMPGWSAASADSDPWIGYDFGAGNDVEIFEIAWTSRTDIAFTTNPASLSVEWSDDNVSWTEVAQQGGISAWSSGETKTFEWATSDPAQEVRFHNISLEVVTTGEPDPQVRFYSLFLEVVHSLDELQATWKPQTTIIITS